MNNKISNSATKLVLLYLVFILGLLTAFIVVWSTVTGNTNEMTSVVFAGFSGVVGVVIGHYFKSNGDPTLPFGGK